MLQRLPSSPPLPVVAQQSCRRRRVAAIRLSGLRFHGRVPGRSPPRNHDLSARRRPRGSGARLFGPRQRWRVYRHGRRDTQRRPRRECRHRQCDQAAVGGRRGEGERAPPHLQGVWTAAQYPASRWRPLDGRAVRLQRAALPDRRQDAGRRQPDRRAALPAIAGVHRRRLEGRSPKTIRAIREGCRGLANVVNAGGNPAQPAGPDDPRCQIRARE